MTQRSSTDIATDLAAARAARSALIAGERVENVMRDGRRVGYAGVSLKEIEAAIATLEREYEAAVAVEAGSTRRRPINLAWQN